MEGDAFLHNMVRILVGTIADVARGRLEAGAIRRALLSRNRRDAGITAPAAGLYLEQVLMVNEGSNAWPPPDEERKDVELPDSRCAPFDAPQARLGNRPRS